MNSFSLNRFGKTLRWYVSANFLQLMGWTVGVLVGFFFFNMIPSYDLSYSTTIEHMDGAHKVENLSITKLSMCIIHLIVFIEVSVSMAVLNKKTFRSSFLMLPASNLEKYLSLLTHVLVILPVCIFFGFVLGDSLRMAVRVWLYDAPWQSFVPDMLRSLGFDFSDPSWLPFLILNVLTIAWLLSLYVLGATFLRRFSFVVSSIVVILSLVAFWQFSYSLGLTMYSEKWIDGNVVSLSMGFIAYALFVLLPLLAAFNFWASYRIFKRFQLVTNKWTNYDVFKR